MQAESVDKLIKFSCFGDKVCVVVGSFLFITPPARDSAAVWASFGRPLNSPTLSAHGVTRIGAIAGYSKAMFKYKLNKQNEQIGSILDYVTLHYEDLDRIDVPNGTNITRLLTKLGAIPLEMIKEQNSNYAYDVFNNQIYIYHNIENTSIKPQYYGLEVSIDKNAYDICRNLYQMAKLRSSMLWITQFTKDNESGGTNFGNRVFGDSYCTKNATYCLKALTLEQMHELCSYCSDSSDRCLFVFLWNYKTGG